MGNIVLLIFCLVAGIGLRQAGRLPTNTSAVLNAFIINIGLPAMALGYLNRIELSPALAFAAAAPWIMFLAAAAILWPLCQALGLARQTTGCLILVCGLGNTSFIGLPMIEAFYGTEWFSVGIVMDQLGSYVVLSILGITAAQIFASRARPEPRDILMRILRFPPFLATLAALALSGVAFPIWLAELLGRLAATVAPLALVSVGFQLRLSDLGGKFTPLLIGLGFKLLLGPLLIYLLYVSLLGGRGTITQVTVFEMAMAPMIGASIVAMENDLDPQLATLLVGIGVPISFVTLTIWHLALLGI